jgi:hypothetical protein
MVRNIWRKLAVGYRVVFLVIEASILLNVLYGEAGRDRATGRYLGPHVLI